MGALRSAWEGTNPAAVPGPANQPQRGEQFSSSGAVPVYRNHYRRFAATADRRASHHRRSRQGHGLRSGGRFVFRPGRIIGCEISRLSSRCRRSARRRRSSPCYCRCCSDDVECENRFYSGDSPRDRRGRRTSSISSVRIRLCGSPRGRVCGHDSLSSGSAGRRAPFAGGRYSPRHIRTGSRQRSVPGHSMAGLVHCPEFAYLAGRSS